MPSKTKSKKLKLKRTVANSCWSQNDDGTLSLVIGSKNNSKNNSDSESSDIPNNLQQDTKSPIVQNCIGNLKNGVVLKSPQLPGNVISPIKTPNISTPVLGNTAIKILKSNWSQNVDNYRQRQQIKRRDEMMAG